MKHLAIALAILLAPGVSQAGLHLSLETVNDLPAQWRGLLPDLRRLRMLALPAAEATRSATFMRDTYSDALLKLENEAKSRALTADEAADLGALLVRFGSAEKAVAVLREARRKHPDHFALAANLGTAWQLAGNLDAAGTALDDAVRLAPAKWKAAETAHRRLVQLRIAAKDNNDLDALFGSKPPADALAITQHLAIWLPGDGRVLWQLGELAHSAGDVRTAANILDGCVTEFGMKSPTLRDRRVKYRAAADALEAKNEHNKPDDKQFKSARALGRLFNEAKLPRIDAKKINELPWLAMGETTIAQPFKPQYLKYIQDLDGHKVTVLGFMRPLGGEKGGEISGFLLTEYPVGCWFCEVPDRMSLIVVELANGTEVTRDAIRIEGTFKINRDDPEAYYFRITDAKVKIAD